MPTKPLQSAAELARLAPASWPNESPEYRAARTALLADEIELRRQIVRVAEQRRTLPPGGEVPENYTFEGKEGPVTLSEIFGDKDTLVVYSMMYGPERKSGCPMCSALLDAWDGEARHIEQRVALAVVARSPIGRILDYADERGWSGLKFYSDNSGNFTRNYVGDADADVPAYTVFHRQDGTIRHFYSLEGRSQIANPGQDPHPAPDLNPLWILLDTVPEGRGTDWYPKLDDRN